MDALRTVIARMMACRPFWDGRKDKVQVTHRRDGKWIWRRFTPDGEPFAGSLPDAFITREACVKHLERSGWIWGGYELIENSRKKS